MRTSLFWALSGPKLAIPAIFNPSKKKKNWGPEQGRHDPLPDPSPWGKEPCNKGQCEDHGANASGRWLLGTVATGEQLVLGHPNPIRKPSLNLVKASPHCMRLPSSLSPIAIEPCTATQTSSPSSLNPLCPPLILTFLPNPPLLFFGPRVLKLYSPYCCKKPSMSATSPPYFDTPCQ